MVGILSLMYLELCYEFENRPQVEYNLESEENCPQLGDDLKKQYHRYIILTKSDIYMDLAIRL